MKGINLVVIAQERIKIGMAAGKAATSGITTALDAAATAALIKRGGPIGAKAGGIFSKFTGFMSKILPGLARFGAGIFGVARGVTAFLGPIGLAITAVTSLAAVIFWLVGEEQKRQEKLKGFGEAVSVSTDKLNSWSDMLGLERRITPLERLKAGIAPGSGKATVQDAATKFTTDETFLSKDKGFGEQIEAFRTATKAQATAILSTVSSSLFASGATEDQVQAVILAIQAAAKNKEIKIEFKDINFATKEGRAGIEKNVNDLLAEFDKVANNPKNQKKTYSGGRMGGKMVTTPTPELRESTSATAQFLTTQLSNLQAMLEGGKITAKEYSQSVAQIETALRNSANGGMIATVMMKQLSSTFEQSDAAFAEAIAGVQGLGNQMFVWKAIMAGAINNATELASAIKYLGIASDTTGKYTPQEIATAKAALKVISDKVLKYQQATEDAAKATNAQINAGTKEKSIYEQATESLKDRIKEIRNSVTAYNRLTRAGVSASSAVEIANDKLFAEAIAKTKVGTKQWKNLIALIKEYKKVLDTGPAKTPEDKMTETVDMIIENINNRKNVIELQFAVNTRKDKTEIAAQEAIVAAKEVMIDDYEAGLTRLEDKEEIVNDQYDKRIQALDEIEKANQRISEQKNAELSISQALAKGDVGAAAAAIQAEQQRQAEEAFGRKRESLEKQRKAALEGLTAEVTIGYDAEGKAITRTMTRNEIEKDLKKIKKEIFEIEEKMLEPARERIRLQEVARDKAIDELRFQGLTIEQWSLVKGNIVNATTSAGDYIKKIEEGLAVLRKHKEYWAGINGGDYNSLPNINDPLPPGPGGPGTPSDTTIIPTPTPTPIDTDKPDKDTGAGKKKTNPAYTAALRAHTAAEKARTDHMAKITKLRTDIKTLEDQRKSTSKIDRKDELTGQIARLQTQLSAASSDVRFYNTAVDNALRTLKNTPQYLAGGGMVMPQRFFAGGFAKGTDTVPAMLTPGEFVMSKYAVDSYGLDTMKSINSGEMSGSSVYNSYQVNVNVRSDANPDQIARAVMGQIRQINNQQLRGRI
jgi:hypothetical protein